MCRLLHTVPPVCVERGTARLSLLLSLYYGSQFTLIHAGFAALQNGPTILLSAGLMVT